MESVEQKSVGQIRSIAAPAPVKQSHSGTSLALEQIVHRFGEMVALKDVNLDIKPG